MAAGKTDGESKIEGGRELQLPLTAWTWSERREDRSCACSGRLGRGLLSVARVEKALRPPASKTVCRPGVVVVDEGVRKADDVALAELWVVNRDPVRQ